MIRISARQSHEYHDFPKADQHIILEVEISILVVYHVVLPQLENVVLSRPIIITGQKILEISVAGDALEIEDGSSVSLTFNFRFVWLKWHVWSRLCMQSHQFQN